MLHLLVRPGSDAYAIPASRVHRILPFARLKSLPSDQPAIAGVLNYHGDPVPVLDLTQLLTGAPSREILGTRIALAEVSLPNAGDRLLGLLTEGAHSVVRIDPGAFRPAGIRPDGRPWLGLVAADETGFIQRLEIAALLPPLVLAALLRDSAAALAA